MLCLLSKDSKEEFYYYLLSYKIDYRSSLKISKMSTFGLEIEFLSPQRKINFNNRSVVDVFEEGKKEEFYPYLWQLTEEKMLEGYKKTPYNGMELISPILKDSPQTWFDLSEIISDLKKGGSFVNGRCGGHIHYGISSLNLNKLKTFLKLYVSYEDVLMYYGQRGISPRSCLKNYAKPVRKEIRKILASGNDVLCELSKLSTMSSMNISSNTIEFRSPDGTLDEIVWQNNVNTYGHLVELFSSAFDEEFIDYRYKNVKAFSFEKALELSDIIFNDTYDKECFLSQCVQKEGRK